MAKIFYLLKQNKNEDAKIYGKWFAHAKSVETLNTRKPHRALARSFFRGGDALRGTEKQSPVILVDDGGLSVFCDNSSWFLLIVHLLLDRTVHSLTITQIVCGVLSVRIVLPETLVRNIVFVAFLDDDVDIHAAMVDGVRILFRFILVPL